MRQFPIKRSFLTCLAIGAAAFPAVSQARPLEDPAGSVAGAPAQAVSAVPETAAGVSSGFQWDDAGIGAAGAVVLLGVGAGAATTVRRRRAGGVATT
ncbi:MAG TPA: hypothetical protein VGF91_14185 [Solirubrobacteraceae bacterium]